MITNEDCIKVLQNYLKKSEINLKRFELKAISENAEGFLGEHYKLIITYENNGKEEFENFFVKNKPTKNKIQIEMADNLEVYKREIFLYDVLLKEFDKYDYDITFAAKSYHCIEAATLVLEDLTTKNFLITDRHTMLTLDHIKYALKALSKYHAAGYAYERRKSEELGRPFNLLEEYNECLQELFFIQLIDVESYAMKWWVGCDKTIDVLISLLPQDEHHKKKFRDLLKKHVPGKVFAEETNIAKTSCHGDLWSNNMMFKYEENKVVDCRLVDFQVIRYFYPSFDVILAIYCNSNAEFRKAHLQELYQYYYKSLSDFMKKYNYSIEDIHPEEDFYKTIAMTKADALKQVVLTNCIICMPKDKLTNFVNNDEEGMQKMMFENSEMVEEAFKIDVNYQNIIIETMNELYDALLHIP